MPGGGFIQTVPSDRADEQNGRKVLPLWQMLMLTCSLGGIQFAWTVEFAYGTPYLQSLGMPKPLLALVWLAGPLSGGALVMLLSVIMVAYSKEFAQLTSSVIEDHNSLTIFYAVFGFYLLDFSINTVTTSARALIVDAVPIHQQDRASVWASRMAGIGNVAGYFTGCVDLTWFFEGTAKAHPILFGTQLKILCFISNVFLVICLVLACLSVEEKRIQSDPEHRKMPWYAPLMDIVRALKRLPAPLQSICNVQFFAWLGWFPFLFYVSAWVGERVPDSNPPNPVVDAAAKQRAGAFALLLKAVLALIASGG
ncbi:hypothetical protein HDU67_005576 [Dinochytrium kinnereticum]|nr:hypothetical protein HDU67_005576 [Dinochytrium kinnereticum]